MGVRGLTTFIAQNSDRYHKKSVLADCTLIIDGNCIASHLFKWYTKRDSAFGGDYDEYALIVKNFFCLLKKFNITPYVFFDGSYETKKLKTVVRRSITKLITLKHSFCKGFSSEKFFPQFMLRVFYDVVESLKVFVIQCEFEADGEIAALARQLDCPIMSYDSDFYIFDVKYIPFSTVEILISNESKGLHCCIYDVNEFFKKYPGLNKTHLPLLATILGNDFVDNYIFNKFFSSIPLSKKTHATFLGTRIDSTLHWLSRESEKSAINKILSHIGKINHDKFLKGLDTCKQNYCSEPQCEIICDEGKTIVKPPKYVLQMPQEVEKLLSAGKLPSFITNVICHRVYFLPILVEDLTEDSAHLQSIPIILAIDRLVTPQENNRNLKVYIRRKKYMNFETLPNPLRIEENTEILLKSSIANQSHIFKILDFHAHDQNLISSLHEGSQLFVLCCIFWIKTANPSTLDIHSLLFSYLACQAKNQVGLCRVNGSDCTAKESAELTRLLKPFRKTTQSSMKSYCISHVHTFNVFQSILNHCSVLNTLLGTPFHHCKIPEALCGTLNYNIWDWLTGQIDALQALKELLDPVPRLWELYENFFNPLSSYFPHQTPGQTKLPRKRSKKKKKKNMQKTETDEDNEADLEVKDEIYEDICNKFSLLCQ